MSAVAPVSSLPMLSLPLLGLEKIDDDWADELLVDWGHNLGGCNRPFGRQSFALYLNGVPASVAVSASTVNARCGGYRRQEVVELARLCSDPDHADLTRPMLRLWRKVAASVWPYWPVTAYVSYSDSTRHKGDIYRFDGWRFVEEVRGGTGGGSWGKGKKYPPKKVWAFDVPAPTTSPVGEEG